MSEDTRSGRWRYALAAAALALTLVGAASSHPSASSVAPGAVPDQANPARPPACRYAAWAPDYSASWAAQTFTAGISGALTDVVIPLRVRTSQIAVVAVVPLDASGRPVLTAPLAATTRTLTDGATYVETEFSFSPPPRVQRDRQYALVLSSPNVGVANDTNYVAWRNDVGSSYTDDRGTPCADGAYAQGRTWVSGDATVPPPGADADFFFQTFVVPDRQVTVVPAGTGDGTIQDASRSIDCGPTCTARFLVGETVTLTAAPAPTSTFAGWSGGCAGTTATCSLVVAEDVTVGAEFTRKLVRLRVRKVGAGTVTSRPPGLRCGNRCSYEVAVGTTVTLSAKPARGWSFRRWSGGCRGTRPVCRLTATRASTAIATFRR